MSANIISIDTAIGRAISTAQSGDLNGAIAVLNQTGLTEDQKAKIEAILKQPRSDMQQRIAEVVGEVSAPSTALSLIAPQSLQTGIISIAGDFIPDIIGRLFNYVFRCDFRTGQAMACINKHWNNCSQIFIAGLDLNDLKQLCPKLTILDAGAQGIVCDDEPVISKPLLLKGVREMSPHVEGDEGVTLLTMTKGTTLNQLIENAKVLGITIDVGWDDIIEKLGNIPVEQTYRILITNNVFLNSREQDFNQHQTLVEGHGCTMPTVQEYVALCIFTNKVFKKSLFGLNPLTYARSSTVIDEAPLIVGSCSKFRLNVNASFGIDSCGAAGKKKL